MGALALQTSSLKWDTFGSSQMAGKEKGREGREDELEAA